MFRNDRSVKRDYSIIAQVDRIIAKAEKSESVKATPAISTNFETYVKKAMEKSDNKAISRATRYRINTMAENVGGSQRHIGNGTSKAKLEPQLQNFTRLNIGLIAGIETEKPKELIMKRPTFIEEETTTVSTEVTVTTEKRHGSSIEHKQANLMEANLMEANQEDLLDEFNKLEQTRELKNENPMEALEIQERANLDSFKKDKKNEIEKINCQIEDYNIDVENYEENLKVLTNDKELLEEQYKDQVGVNKEFENDIMNKDKYLSALLNKDFEQDQVRENEKLNEEIQELEKMLEDTKTDLQDKLVEAKKDYENKTSEIQYLEEKIEYFEENYPNLVTNLKGALELRIALSNDYEQLPKDLKREHLTQMVTHITMKTKVHRKLTKETSDMIDTVKEEIADNDANVKNCCTSIEVTIKGEKKKDKNNEALLECLNKIKTIFDHNAKSLYEIVAMKTQNRIIEDKVREMEKNRYEENNEALREELQDVSIA